MGEGIFTFHNVLCCWNVHWTYPICTIESVASIKPKHEAFEFELQQPSDGLYISQKNSTVEEVSIELKNTSDLSGGVLSEKLLIIITPAQARPLQANYLGAHDQTDSTPSSVEMNYQSVETAELLRNSGVMYRHLVCSVKNATQRTDRNALLRNVAVSHIETHRLDGIVYFADDDRADLFHQMRNISRIGTWTVAKLVQGNDQIVLEGPICNGLQVVGWHIVDMERRSRRFHAEISGFAFNSTMIWDTMRWHRPTLEPIRQLERVKQDMLASRFMEQLVEGESQMECLPTSASGILVWISCPRNWFEHHQST